MPGKRKRQAYDNAFKIRVKEFSENLNNNSAAEREFSISEKLVHDWRKNKDTIVSGPNKQKRRVVRISPYDAMEMDLNVYEIRKQKISDSTYEANILNTPILVPKYTPRLMSRVEL
ncbi:hypothetical protein DPMN_117467 [Dreissena polymorpha]|uniref:Brinker DNA-binding domain-containing protein n=1 Tax=Dreissena polymorpha TaxID=45954 RepID=A0A9D4QV83_DREPO|nr:hypothetical protein DPMN_117467 [Dreissena polymorpha]